LLHRGEQVALGLIGFTLVPAGDIPLGSGPNGLQLSQVDLEPGDNRPASSPFHSQTRWFRPQELLSEFHDLLAQSLLPRVVVAGQGADELLNDELFQLG